MHLQYRIHPTWISCLQPAVQHVEVPGLAQSTLGSPPGGVAEDDRQLECNHGGQIERYTTLLHISKPRSLIEVIESNSITSSSSISPINVPQSAQLAQSPKSRLMYVTCV